MPYTKIQFAAGFDKQNTDITSKGKWTDGDKVRFRYGSPEKIGGWEKVSETTFKGVARAQLAWNSLNGTAYDAIGTHKKLYIYSEGNFFDATPQRLTADITSVFTTTNGSSLVTVTHSSHGASEGDFVTISSTSAATAGISAAVMDDEHEITSVTDLNNYIIDVGTNATSTVSTTNNCTVNYEIQAGRDRALSGYGWGTGTWDSSQTWDSPNTSDSVTIALRSWALDNWGEDILALDIDGGLFIWNTSGGISTASNVAAAVSNAPTKSKFMIVSNPDRHVVCFGTETTIGTTSTQDPMFIRWSDQDNETLWAPSATNSAGSQRIVGGSEIVTAVRTRGQILVLSDTSAHGMSFIGAPFVFGFQQLGSNCGAISPHCAIDVGGVSYWMSSDAFFVFDGTVRKLPCPVEDFVFNNIDTTQYEQVWTGSNSAYGEVWWFYCSIESNQIDKYVIYNYQEGLWYTGSLDRSTWIDSGTYQLPYATKYDGSANTTLYVHETGKNDDGATMTSFIESGDFDIGDGDDIMLINKVIPDFKDQVGNVNITMKSRYFPTDTQTEKGPFHYTTSNSKINVRTRGRQVALRLESNGYNNVGNDALNEDWRLGTFRFEVQPDGKR
tara:strand:- start:160 stop:1995 length:1836 start_codon:yes stop_codon:yes gene_type:complete